MTHPPPPTSQNPTDLGTWIALGPVKQFSESRPRICQVGPLKLAIFRKDNRLYAIQNKCPHAAASLGLGQFKGLLVACPRHHWQFNVATGACLTTPSFCVQTFPIRIQHGIAEVQVPPPDSEALPEAQSADQPPDDAPRS